MWRIALVLVTCVACVPQLKLEADVPVSCEKDSDCPIGSLCAVDTFRCRSADKRDAVAPVLLSVIAESPTLLLATFDEPISPLTRELERHSIPGLSVLGAELRGQVQLAIETSLQLGGEPYLLNVRARDEFGNEADAPLQREFTGFGVTANKTPVSPLSPSQEARVFTATVDLAWSPRVGASSYAIDIAEDPTFSQVVTGASIVTSDTAFTFVIPDRVTYYWRVRSNLQSETTSVVSVFHAMEDVLYVSCAADEVCGLGGAGNRSQPLRSVAEAVELAAALGLGTVRVAGRGGDQRYLETTISIRHGVLMEGGFSPSFAARDHAAYPTVIQGDAPIVVQVVSQTAPVVIDGFELRGPQDIGGGNALFVSDCRDRVIVRNSHMVGGLVEGGESYAVVLRASTNGPGCSPLLENNIIEGGTATGASFGYGFGLFSYNTNLVLRGGRVHGGTAAIATAISVVGGTALIEDVEEIAGVTYDGALQGFGVTAKARDTADVGTSASITLRRVASLVGTTKPVFAAATALSLSVSDALVEDCPAIVSGAVVNDGTGSISQAQGIRVDNSSLVVRRSLVQSSFVSSTVSSGSSIGIRTGGTDGLEHLLVLDDAQVRALGVDSNNSSTIAVSIQNTVNASILHSLIHAAAVVGPLTGIRVSGINASGGMASLRGEIDDNEIIVGDSPSYGLGVAIRMADVDGSVRFTNNRVSVGSASVAASFNESQINDPVQLGVSCSPCAGVFSGNRIVLSGQASQSIAMSFRFAYTGSGGPNNAVDVINNVAVAGNVGQLAGATLASHSVGLQVLADAGPTPVLHVTNNLFLAGGGVFTTSVRSLPVRLAITTFPSATPAEVDLSNNLFVSLPSGLVGEAVTRTCLDAGNSAAIASNLGMDPRSLRHNAFVGCPARLAVSAASAVLAGTGVVESTFSDAAGNQELADAVSLSFADLPMRSFALTLASPAGVRLQGLDASLNVCGAGGTQSCGEVSKDLAGNDRSCSDPGNCYSIGPYEL